MGIGFVCVRARARVCSGWWQQPTGSN